MNYISGRHNESCVSTSVQKMRICVLFIASLRLITPITDYTIVYHIMYSFRMCSCILVYVRVMCVYACAQIVQTW